MTADLEPLFPDNISDEAAAVLADFLHTLAFVCDSRYFTQLVRFHDRRREPVDPEQPWNRAYGKPGG